MPTVLRQDGFVVRVYGPPREHQPPHAHVERGSEEVVVIRLGSGAEPPSVWAVYGMQERDVVRAFRVVEQHLEQIRQAWRKLHG